MTRFGRSLVLGLLPLAALSLRAVEVDLGLQAYGALPLGTFGDSAHLDRRPGLGLGLQVPIDLGEGHVLRPKLDFLTFRRNSDGFTYRTDSWVLMADYLYYLTGEKEGIYLLGGAGLHTTRRDFSWLLAGQPARGDGRTTGFAYNVGLGYAISPSMGVELRFLGMDMGRLDGTVPRGFTDPRFTGNALTLAFSITF